MRRKCVFQKTSLLKSSVSLPYFFFFFKHSTIVSLNYAYLLTYLVRLLRRLNHLARSQVVKRVLTVKFAIDILWYCQLTCKFKVIWFHNCLVIDIEWKPSYWLCLKGRSIKITLFKNNLIRCFIYIFVLGLSTNFIYYLIFSTT